MTTPPDGMAPMTAPADPVFAWLEVLDELTYYELFGISSEAGPDEVRAAFHEFCDTFHPDRHLSRGPDERRALSTIFKRGTEAYLVLSDLGLRGRYDAQLAVRASSRPPRMSLGPLSGAPSGRAPSGGGARSLEDAARSPSARPFARRAEELIAQGDLQHAKLQLLLATHRDPGNEALEAALRDVQAKLALERRSRTP